MQPASPAPAVAAVQAETQAAVAQLHFARHPSFDQFFGCHHAFEGMTPSPRRRPIANRPTPAAIPPCSGSRILITSLSMVGYRTTSSPGSGAVQAGSRTRFAILIDRRSRIPGGKPRTDPRGAGLIAYRPRAPRPLAGDSHPQRQRSSLQRSTHWRSSPQNL